MSLCWKVKNEFYCNINSIDAFSGIVWGTYMIFMFHQNLFYICWNQNKALDRVFSECAIITTSSGSGSNGLPRQIHWLEMLLTDGMSFGALQLREDEAEDGGLTPGGGRGCWYVHLRVPTLSLTPLCSYIWHVQQINNSMKCNVRAAFGWPLKSEAD